MICELCPRCCRAERTETKAGGLCGMPTLPVVAKAMLHQWEEPCLVGEHGAGTVFFSGCNLRCNFCQNGVISQENFGKLITVDRLRDIFRELIDQGAACLDLVTPTHFADAVLESLGNRDWGVPVGWNCGGYEREDARDCSVAACWEFLIPGCGRDINNIDAVSFVGCLDAALRKLTQRHGD
ncbi:MAG: 4Fe-4S cluster-binding domain-containing protein, partial [Oscillibacter sp.]|nr:4Fe-4S cluster-binding domain-containing protein [Oscillibacter sp.]